MILYTFYIVYKIEKGDTTKGRWVATIIFFCYAPGGFP